MDPAPVSPVANVIKQHGLANAAKTHEKKTFGWSAPPDPLDRHLCTLTEIISSNQRWRLSARARSVGITDGVHG
jgi:hypothetical protein